MWGVASPAGRKTGSIESHSPGDPPHPGPLPGGEGGRKSRVGRFLEKCRSVSLSQGERESEKASQGCPLKKVMVGQCPGSLSVVSVRVLAFLIASMVVPLSILAAEPLQVTARVPSGPHLVGQAIELDVAVEGATEVPVVEPPRSAVADVLSLPKDASRPFLTRFVMIPRQAGSLTLPPFRARSGDRSGISKPTRLAVASVPPEGRTSAFLGGVGSFEIRAEAEPKSLRPGQTLEYRIKLTGPAAWGSVRGPDLGGWSSLAPNFRVETLPDTLEGADPPVRTFRYRLRPLKAGSVTLPPLAVAAFDPISRRYATRVTAGVPIRVEEPPRFNPSRLDYRPIMRPAPGGRPGFFVIAFAVVLGLLATLGSALWSYAKRKREASRADHRTLALAMAQGLAGSEGPVESARMVTEALTTFLERVECRGPGVLTPPEAREAIERLTSDRELARRGTAHRSM